MAPEILLLKPKHEHSAPLQRALQSDQKPFPRSGPVGTLLGTEGQSRAQLPVASWVTAPPQVALRDICNFGTPPPASLVLPGYLGKFPLGLCPCDQERFTSRNQADARLPGCFPVPPNSRLTLPTSECPQPFRDFAAPTEVRGGGGGQAEVNCPNSPWYGTWHMPGA